jgi:regulatory protein
MGSSIRSAQTPHAAALRLLARRDHSVQELSDRLTRRGFDTLEIQAALARLRRDRHIDDDRLAATYARARAERGYGPIRIRKALREKGIARETADRAVAAAFEEPEGGGRIDDLLDGYLRRHAGFDPARRIRSARAFLLRRGFPPSTVRDRLRARHAPLLRAAASEAWESGTEEPES